MANGRIATRSVINITYRAWPSEIGRLNSNLQSAKCQICNSKGRKEALIITGTEVHVLVNAAARVPCTSN